MTQIHDFELDVRRHSDGSIDFDHYRSRATALRGAALRDASTLRSTFKFIMILAVAIGGVVLVANAPSIVRGAWSRSTSRRPQPTSLRFRAHRGPSDIGNLFPASASDGAGDRRARSIHRGNHNG